jgi:hypothetical protein
LENRPPDWDRLSKIRWGDARYYHIPGIVIVRPSGRPVVLVDDPEERAAIKLEGCNHEPKR